MATRVRTELLIAALSGSPTRTWPRLQASQAILDAEQGDGVNLNGSNTNDAAIAINKRETMELRRKRPIYDLNKPEDRAYLLNRGFVWAVIYPHGQNRGKS